MDKVCLGGIDDFIGVEELQERQESLGDFWSTVAVGDQLAISSAICI